jgi:hypothetical protein
MLHYLTDRAAAEGRRLAITPRRIRVHLRWADGQGASRGGSLGAGGWDTAGLFGEARRLLQGLLTRRMGLRNLGVELSRFHPLDGAQLRLFPAAPEARRCAPVSATPSPAAESPVRPAATGRLRSASRQRELDDAVDEIRGRFGFRCLVRGPSLELLDRLPSDAYGFILRTPCLSR